MPHHFICQARTIQCFCRFSTPSFIKLESVALSWVIEIQHWSSLYQTYNSRQWENFSKLGRHAATTSPPMNEPHSPDILLIFEQNYVSNTQKEAVIFANFQITQIVDFIISFSDLLKTENRAWQLNIQIWQYLNLQTVYPEHYDMLTVYKPAPFFFTGRQFPDCGTWRWHTCTA